MRRWKHMENINIVIASDNNYAQHLGIAIISVLENNDTKENLIFHILDNGISGEQKEKIISIEKKYQTKIIFYKIDASLLNNLPEIGHLTKATYLRLFITEILPSDINKIIYLDCDLIILKNIKELYYQDLKQFSLAAIRDVKAKEILRIYFYPGLKSYFNAGVLLINLQAWREKDIISQFLKFLDNYKNEISTADQDILNCLFKDDWLEINNKFNLDLKHQPINALPKQETVILHYSDKIKPWSYFYCGKNKKYYFKYLANSPWADFKYKDKNLKNAIKKYLTAINKTIRNILRPLVPNSLIDWNKKKFLKNQIKFL